MKTKHQTSSDEMLSAGIDYHKKYSVVHVVNSAGETVCKGRVQPNSPAAFEAFFAGFRKDQIRCVFEASMNWGYLYDILDEIESVAEIKMANPYKTRIIAEAHIKTDKLDAQRLAELNRVDMICESHTAPQKTRYRKEMIRQRAYFVKQRTAMRNRIHLLISSQRNLQLPQVTDLFGKKGLAALSKAQLAEPHRQLMLEQDLALLKELNLRIRESEQAMKGELEDDDDYKLLLSMPGVGPIIAAVLTSEIDGIGRFRRSQRFLGYAGLVPSVSSSGGKTYHGRMIKSCNKWLKWAFIEAAWVAIGCDSYFGGLYRSARDRGKKPNTAITIAAHRMATIVYRMLTERREYEPFAQHQSPGCPA